MRSGVDCKCSMTLSSQFAEQQAIIKTQRLNCTPAVEALHVMKDHRLYQPHARSLALRALHQQPVAGGAQEEGHGAIVVCQQGIALSDALRMVV